MEEKALQSAIMDAVNKSMDSDGSIGRNAVNGLLMILKPQENAGYTLDEVKRRIQELTAEFDTLLEMDGSEETEQDRFSEITKELAELKKKQESISAQLRNNQGLQAKVNSFASAAEQLDHHMTEWDEECIRQVIHTVEVISADRICVVLTDGTVVMQQFDK
jgi:DNA repair exonuclease SbcCD ATPase subunit